MGLDIRLPIGFMFALIGLLLAGNGFLTRDNTALYARCLGININLVWGVFLLLFGLGMLLAAYRCRKRQAAEENKMPKSEAVAGRRGENK